MRWSLALGYLLAAVFAVSVADGAAVTQGSGKALTPSVGSRYEEAAFVSLELRPDGRILAQRNEELATFSANGVPSSPSRATAR